MDKLTNEEYSELYILSDQIRELKLKRVELFGKEWNKVSNIKYPSSLGKDIDRDMADYYLRKIDEQMALNGYTKGKFLASISLSRAVYASLTNGRCSNKANNILSSLDWDNL
jgi:hypothetical protein